MPYLLLICTVLLLAMSVFHKLFPPTIDTLKPNYLKLEHKDGNALLCSATAKVAYANSQKELITIKSYCGILNSWQEVSHININKKHLDTEFSTLTYTDYMTQAEAQKKDGQYRDCIQSLEKAIYHRPNSEEAYLQLAHSYKHLGDRALSLKHYHKALAINPASYQAHRGIAHMYLEDEAYQKAHTHLQRSLSIKPDAQSYSTLAQVELILGKTEQAVTSFEHSLNEENNNTLVLNKLGLLYWQKHDYKKAADVFERAYKTSPEDSTHLLNYYEISLIEPTPLSEQEKDNFLKMFSDKKSVLMVFHMLHIIEKSIRQEETFALQQQWSHNYAGVKLNWSLSQILSWLNTSTLDEERKFSIKKVIRFFIAYQQAYNLEHQTIPTGENI